MLHLNTVNKKFLVYLSNEICYYRFDLVCYLLQVGIVFITILYIICLATASRHMHVVSPRGRALHEKGFWKVIQLF